MEHSMNLIRDAAEREAPPPATWRPLGVLAGMVALRAAAVRETGRSGLAEAGPAVAWAAE